MSTQEIIDELPKLNPEELSRVKEKLAELENTQGRQPRTGWGRALSKFAGTISDLPEDMSVNHDHYLYGTPKRE